jgi:hypothetical protein
LDIKVAVFDPVLFVFLNKPRKQLEQTRTVRRARLPAHRQQRCRSATRSRLQKLFPLGGNHPCHRVNLEG